jgi:hypothetical protein
MKPHSTRLTVAGHRVLPLRRFDGASSERQLGGDGKRFRFPHDVTARQMPRVRAEGARGGHVVGECLCPARHGAAWTATADGPGRWAITARQTQGEP